MHNDTPRGGFSISAGYEPGLIGRVGELHGRYYASVWNSGAPFEILALRQFSDFIEHYDPERDLVLAAHADGELVGSISIVSRPEVCDGHADHGDGARCADQGVQLRFFIVDPACHGRGIGKALLHAALDWCRMRGYRKIFLWTVDNLPQSRGLYESVGFRVTERVPDDRYTVMRDNLKLEMVLE